MKGKFGEFDNQSEFAQVYKAFISAEVQCQVFFLVFVN